MSTIKDEEDLYQNLKNLSIIYTYVQHCIQHIHIYMYITVHITVGERIEVVYVRRLQRRVEWRRLSFLAIIPYINIYIYIRILYIYTYIIYIGPHI